jgi:hypothetical protein
MIRTIEPPKVDSLPEPRTPAYRAAENHFWPAIRTDWFLTAGRVAPSLRRNATSDLFLSFIAGPSGIFSGLLDKVRFRQRRDVVEGDLRSVR